MAGVTLFGFQILKSQTEREIHKLFAQHEKTLSAQKSKLFDDITEWGDALMRAIYKHVTYQKYLLEQEYLKQIEYLNTTCQRFIEELHVHEEMKNTQQMDQLLDQCKTLKFELAALEYHGQPVPFIEVPIKEAQVKNQDEFHIIENENDKFDNNSTGKDDNEIDDNTDATSKLFRNILSTSANQTPAPLSRTNSEYVSGSSINSNDDNKFSDVRNNNLLKKCPICFMIFPSTMKAPDRSQHVQEHYKDD